MTKSTRAVITGIIAAGLLLPAVSTFAKDKKASAEATAAMDRNKDGALDLAEAKAAASALFDKREGDKDGTLTAKELQGRLSKKDLKAGDPDNDGTLTKEEFLALIEQRFKAANRDNDATVDAKEMATPEGKALKQLLK